VKLNRNARQTIKDSGVTIAAYMRHYGGSATTWDGDMCGCTDDRCADGYHHAGMDDCRCLPVLIEMMNGS
jgi:hypothetical protein